MSILETIRNANNGTLIDDLGNNTNIDDAGELLGQLIPQIAEKVRQKAENDPQDYQLLFEVLDDEEQQNYLENPDWSFSEGALEDGEDILTHLYGNDLPPAPDDVDPESWKQLSAFAATYTIAAMANRNQSMMSAALADDGGPSIWSMLIDAIIKGIIRAIKDATRPRRRRRYRTRRTYGRRRSYRRRTTTRRRKRRTRRRKKPDLEDLIGDLFRD